MNILGIDPGLDGGIALLDSHAGLAVEVIPTIGTKRREVDGAALARRAQGAAVSLTPERKVRR